MFRIVINNYTAEQDETNKFSHVKVQLDKAQ